jgi:hypothetical protein
MPVNAPPATPPVVPIRRSGWPARRASVPVLLAAVVIAAGVALVSIAHKPSTAQRASDLNAFMHDMNTAVESCAGGVRESLSAMRAVEAGSGQVATASKLISYNAANCSPANSQPLADLTQYQVTESLSSFNLKTCVNDFVTWAFPFAMQAQQDMGTVVAARDPASRARASATLAQAGRKLDAERAAIYSILAKAERSLSDHAARPALPTL